MRRVTSSLAVLGILSFGAIVFWHSSGPIAPLLAQQPAEGEKAKPEKVTKPFTNKSDITAKDESVEEKLSRKMDFAFENISLTEALSKISNEAGVEFYIDVKSLDDAGVSNDARVTINLRGVRIGKGMELLLEQLDLTALEHDGLVMVTTKEHAESQLVTRVYDCRDLLTMPAVAFPDVAPAQLPGGPFPGGYGEGIGGYGAEGGYGGGASAVAKAPVSEARPSQLLEIITNAVDTNTWDEVGGPGTMGHYNGLIVITQTASTHKKVEKLLDMMRTAAGLESSKGSKVVR